MIWLKSALTKRDNDIETPGMLLHLTARCQDTGYAALFLRITVQVINHMSALTSTHDWDN